MPVREDHPGKGGSAWVIVRCLKGVKLTCRPSEVDRFSREELSGLKANPDKLKVLAFSVGPTASSVLNMGNLCDYD